MTKLLTELQALQTASLETKALRFLDEIKDDFKKYANDGHNSMWIKIPRNTYYATPEFLEELKRITGMQVLFQEHWLSLVILFVWGSHSVD